MKRDMGFLAPYTIEPDYNDFTKPVIMEGYDNDMGNFFTDLWDKTKDDLEEKAKEQLVKAYDKHGQPIIDDLFKVAVTQADKYLTADEEAYRESAKRLESLAKVGSAATIDSTIEWMKENKWIIGSSVVGVMVLFGMIGYGFSMAAVKKSKR